jgi:NDP-sugar pyrophosphorylase family protein/mannose-6-phosphate isomerase-like protein (cupin superfamily)
MKVVYKPWGKEEWLELNDSYCYKRIHINAGYKTSFQYHNKKKETNYIISGSAEVWLENENGDIEKKIMRAGEYFNVSPPKKHRVIALTDVILQEVSTPEVDDVVRIDDEYARQDGKIEAEHKTPAVLILAAGEGTRLGNLTKHVNKALLPINNKAIISHIIEKFPKEYDIIITTGYKHDIVEEYCKLAHPDRKISFIDASNTQGPGESALKCKHLLQRPFYITTADCLIDSELPHIDGNWLGVAHTSFPEKYSTLEVKNDKITRFVNKSENGYNNAFIGLAGIWNFELFWIELEKNIKNGELVSAFENPLKYPNFKIKKLKWLDTGNLDDLEKTKLYFKDNSISLYKDTGEITYQINNMFIKFNPKPNFTKYKSARAEVLKNLIPKGFGSTKNFIYYYWEEGKTLYEYDSSYLYEKFLNFFSKQIKPDGKISSKAIEDFYINKTCNRIGDFLHKFGGSYSKTKFTVNGKDCQSMDDILLKLCREIPKEFENNPSYPLFHGDLQFDNILHNEETNKFTYIDWREEFNKNNTESGDVYYDLAKLYGGCIIPYNKMKEDNLSTLSEGSSVVDFTIPNNEKLNKFKNTYEKWIIDEGFDLDKVKKLTGIIFLNMSPLHSEKFGKILWFKAIEILS